MKLYTKHELDAMNVTTLKEIAAQINLDGRSKITKATRDYYTEKMVAVFDGMRAEELRVVEKLEGKEWEALRDRVQEALKNGEKMPEVSLANEFPTYKRSLIIAAVKSARNFCNAHGTASQIFIVENYGEEADLKAVAGDMSNALGINWKTCMAAIKVRLGEIGSEIFAGYEKMAKEGVTSRDLDLKPHEVAKRIADAYLAPGRFRMLVKAVADRMDKMREAKTTMTTMAAKTPEQIRQENDEALKAAKLRENAKKSRVAEIFRRKAVNFTFVGFDKVMRAIPVDRDEAGMLAADARRSGRSHMFVLIDGDVKKIYQQKGKLVVEDISYELVEAKTETKTDARIITADESTDSKVETKTDAPESFQKAWFVFDGGKEAVLLPLYAHGVDVSRVADNLFAVKRGSDYEVHENGKSVSARVARRKEVLAAKQA
ncbi:hypothetical protein A2331_04985 [Candidatus Falkowbacteria bacterium RIFOXYB2_FULL_34_18]|uniref:Uncharacterized protein n=1 Tax=Candidatus Falkowbacteria bacterium RIFOXYD2_FULL_34_120 TaxID=1798007 RepID=A0A1F5TN34_9BACT|nr:MAG: hypothetical protein A2500_07265 [Candidatus Falkowbacteria bacterium RIFOXYC12_FULL_34_55]OGF28702.1 MAG: hypothetical protein A2331_04985 [Candidatus Falkowbacteria bacterium RIFOXYB2_FULL_34_18]OGF38067.1 MAG: hypothetical protein A2466_04165 [Candidatus Falkowbacteria bacterium RIFOXYC2_FULL_34_220]OGF38321.1 MAG: hypothetical protein A2515_06195 [Candidatus Falkowbacteria bacterium RIFOXYD12_FULL_34_57]OGF40308.1 MAG: hypothetical protein A2531_00455 [Candidatus Falkowbacteria bact